MEYRYHDYRSAWDALQKHFQEEKLNKLTSSVPLYWLAAEQDSPESEDNESQSEAKTYDSGQIDNAVIEDL